jgi:hypothetical protein
VEVATGEERAVARVEEAMVGVRVEVAGVVEDLAAVDLVAVVMEAAVRAAVVKVETVVERSVVED